jgi:hypothetical protein
MSEFPRYKVKIFDLQFHWDDESHDGPSKVKNRVVPTVSSSLVSPLIETKRTDSSSRSSVIHIAFPMPSEDIFSAQRKVAEVASYLMTSVRSSGSKQKETFLWESGGKAMQVKAHAPAVSHLHVLFRIESGSHSGQTALSLKEAAAVHGSDAKNFAEFDDILTDEGRRTGTVTGKIMVRRKAMFYLFSCFISLIGFVFAIVQVVPSRSNRGRTLPPPLSVGANTSELASTPLVHVKLEAVSSSSI